MARILEICLDSVNSAIEAEKGGANRVELCASLIEGGITPSYGTISLCKQSVKIPINVMIRPRGGDFYYSDEEFEIMKLDIKMCKELGVNGVVFGILNIDGTIDKIRTKILVDLAKPLHVTFHRAFDMTKDPIKALEDLIEIGSIQRVLTSGLESTAIEGLDLIANLVKIAKGRIIILPGGGIHERNINKFFNSIPSLNEIHVFADSKHNSNMQYKNDNIYMGMGLFAPEFLISQTSKERVTKLIQNIV